MSDQAKTDATALAQRALQAVKELRRELDRTEAARTEPIAIVGLACRFPGGVRDADSYWRLLKNGEDAVTLIPRSRWDVDALHDPSPDALGKMTSRHGGFLPEVDGFDAAFFGISPREARAMDPQHRVLLEVSWEALEDAGLARSREARSATGVFVGITLNSYAERFTHAAGLARLDTYFASGNMLSTAAGRLSFALGLKGPCLAIDSACSSSLVAVHLACQSLRAGESRQALVGGVNLLLTPTVSVALSRMQLLSPSGRCRVFDAGADGIVRGEGCGVVVLKRLSDALADSDRIHAVIRGAAVNQNGSGSGFTVPSGAAQQELIRGALAQARVEPALIDYVEAHGTGTALGDPIELNALSAVFAGERTAQAPLLVGSVKTNLGHLESAAGMAGLIKTVLALQHGEVPPHLHFQHLNPNVAEPRAALRIPARATPWPDHGRRRLAGVSSFGLGGTNAHVVLEEPPASASVAEATRPAHLLALSAREPLALRQLAARYRDHLLSHPEGPLGALCFSANAGRGHFEHRLAVTATSALELRERLATFATGHEAEGARHGHARAAPRVAFLFTGEGAQPAGLGRQTAGLGHQLYATQPVFRRVLDQCAEQLQPSLDLKAVLWSAEASLPGPAQAQPATVAVQLALAALWEEWGIQPAIVLGHDVGELAAACVAGALSREDALRLAAARGEAVQALPAGGAMAALDAPEARVREAMAPFAGRVWLAAIDSPRRVVISGERDAVLATAASLGDGARATLLAGSHALHSHLMDPALPALRRALEAVRFQPPRVPLLSTGTGELAGPELGRPDHWLRNLRHPVLFARSLQALHRLGYRHFLELGPHPTLLPLGKLCLSGDAGATWLPSLDSGAADWDTLLASLAGLYVQGAQVRWEAVDRPYAAQRVPLPTYPFQHQRYWIEDSEGPAAQSSSLLGARLPSPLADVQFQARVSQATHPGLWQHPVFGEPVASAATLLELALAAGAHALGTRRLRLEDATFPRPLFLPAEEDLTLQTVLSPRAGGGYGFRIFSLDAGASGEASWQLHATGTVRASPADETRPETEGLEPPAGALEGMIQAAQAALPARDDGALPLPIRVGRLSVQGEVVTALEGVELAPFTRSALLALRSPDRAPASWFHELEWRPESARAAATGGLTGPRRWLILADARGTGAALAGALEARGDTCTLVQSGNDLRLREDGPWDGVVHLWSLELPEAGALDAAALETAALQGCGSAFGLVQALASLGTDRLPRLWLVTRGAVPVGAGAVPGLGQAPIWGLGRVAALEHPELRCTCLDLDPAGDPTGEVEALLAALDADPAESQLALRGSQRHVARLKPSAAFGGPSLPVALRADAAYLITGGLGGMGLWMARWMVKRGSRHLLLLGRRAPSAEAVEVLRELEQAGARVEVLQADVADPAALARALRPAMEAGPRLRGVIHAAGLHEDKLLLNLTWGHFHRVLAPKVAGAWNLHAQTRESPLDFFVLCSSASALLGGLGQANYVAANTFLDRLAHHRRGLGLPAVSIAWGPWRDVGMAKELGVAHWSGLGVARMEPARALDALERCLQGAPAQVGVLDVEWSRYLAQRPASGALLEELAPVSGPRARAASGGFLQELAARPSSGRLELLRGHVQALLCATLGLDPTQPVDPRLGLFRMGMDSLTSLELRTRLQASLGKPLPSSLAMDYPTLEELVAYLAREKLSAELGAGATGAADIPAPAAPATPELDGLSEEQLGALLDEKLSKLDTLLS